jgi:class 3 adenylate cyclase
MGKERFAKSLHTPDETNQFDHVVQKLVELGDLTVGRVTHEPGWHWREHMQPIAGGEWCKARHVGVVISGRLGVQLEDGTEFVLEPEDVFDIPPGHDGWVVGDETLELLEWSGLRAWTGFTGGTQNRMLVTLLFTDVVDSTVIATRLGDSAWHELLAQHYETARNSFDRYRGREVKTTGDGVLATFEAPAAALMCAAAIRDAAIRDGLHIRAGVHLGEVQIVGKDVRGAAVHAAARIMASAGADEIVASETTRSLASMSGMQFSDHGVHELKGLPGEWALFAYRSDATAT